MTARILNFPSRRLADQGGDSGRQRAAPARDIVEVVGLDGALGDQEDTLKRFRARAPATNLPIVPNLPNSSHSRSRSIERQPLPLSPFAKRVVRGSDIHKPASKRMSYVLTSRCKHVSGSFVSANVLQFRRMGDDPNRIRELRTAVKMSQQELGDRAGCSKMTISDLERGNMELTLTYMRRIAPALGVAIADLLPRSENPWALSRDEREYLDRYRHADEAQRLTLQRVTDAVVPPPRRDERAA
jgi:transcriptional regulator with XRE-family HTH domain